MKQITVRWAAGDVTVDLEPAEGEPTLSRGLLGKHVCIERWPGGQSSAWICNGPPEVLGLRFSADTVQEAVDALSERMWKLAAWTKGVFAKPAQAECPSCGTRVRTRRPDGAVRCKCGVSKG